MFKACTPIEPVLPKITTRFTFDLPQAKWLELKYIPRAIRIKCRQAYP
jgi:hypothetical protein